MELGRFLVVTFTWNIIDSCVTTINVTLSQSPQSWYEAEKSCTIISHRHINTSTVFYWIPRLPDFPTQVWVAGQSQLSSMKWIHFVGCFKGKVNTEVNRRAFKSITGPDAIINCITLCSNMEFFTTRRYCICEVKNVEITQEACMPTLCSGTNGGYCGLGSNNCLCHYKNFPSQTQIFSPRSDNKNCANANGFQCEKCENDGRFVCAPNQQFNSRQNTSNIFTRLGDSQAGLRCDGRIQKFNVERVIGEKGDMLPGIIYGPLLKPLDSGDNRLCLALNMANTSTISLVEKPCNCALKALCMNNGSLIEIEQDGFPPGVVATISAFAVVLTLIVSVGIWKYKKSQVGIKFRNCSMRVSELCLQFRSLFPQRSSERIQISHPSRGYAYEGETIPLDQTEGTTPRIGQQDPMSNIYNGCDTGILQDYGDLVTEHEGHYDSTRGDGTEGTYDCLGQSEAQQRVEQRLVGDYDTMATVRAELGIKT